MSVKHQRHVWKSNLSPLPRKIKQLRFFYCSGKTIKPPFKIITVRVADIVPWWSNIWLQRKVSATGFTEQLFFLLLRKLPMRPICTKAIKVVQFISPKFDFKWNSTWKKCKLTLLFCTSGTFKGPVKVLFLSFTTVIYNELISHSPGMITKVTWLHP